MILLLEEEGRENAYVREKEALCGCERYMSLYTFRAESS